MTTQLTLGSPVVTMAAIAIAAASLGVAWHTVRTARRQSAARVAALRAAIHGGAADVAAHEDAGELSATATFGVGAAAVLVGLAGIAIWSLAAPRSAQPLELARLQHAAEAGAFTVSGEVAVPAGRPLRGLSVELVMLDRQGHRLASREAPVAAAPRTSPRPFSVSVPYSGAVDRYTIRFRDVSGLVRHVDRRRVRSATP